jgi:hypothetical protein
MGSATYQSLSQFQQTFSDGNRGPTGIAVFDVNRDGKPDVVLSEQLGETIFLNTTAAGSSSASFASAAELARAGSPQGITAADFNGDGNVDFALANDGGSGAIFLNQTTAGATVPAFAAPTTIVQSALGGNEAILATDLNGDGKPDLVLSGGGVVPNATPTGAASFSALPELVIGSVDGEVIAVADINHDGKLDIIMMTSSSGFVVFLAQ